MTRFNLNGPETGGDQGHPNVCMGLLLEIEYASKITCKRRIGSYSSIGILGGDAVYVDDKPACFHLSKEALEVRRDGALVASLPKEPGMDKAQSFPSTCQ